MKQDAVHRRRGDRLHYEDDGEDRHDLPILLFVHGSCGGSGQWKRLVGALGDEFRKIRVDLFGMGRSEPFPLERIWTPEDDARAIRTLIDHLARPVHFVGHSVGCIFSWSALQEREAKIQSLTLFEPVFFRVLQYEGNPLFAWPENMVKTYSGLLEAGDFEAAIQFFFDHWAGRQGAWAKAPERMREMMRPGAARLYYEMKHLEPSAPDPIEALRRPSAQTLLVQGEKTPEAVQAICETVANARPGTSRKIVPDAGHMAPFTHAEVVATIVREHVLTAERRFLGHRRS